MTKVFIFSSICKWIEMSHFSTKKMRYILCKKSSFRISFIGFNLSCNSLWTHPAFTEVSPALKGSNSDRNHNCQTLISLCFAFYRSYPTVWLQTSFCWGWFTPRAAAGCWVLSPGSFRRWEPRVLPGLLHWEADDPLHSSLLSIPFQPQGRGVMSYYAVQLQGWRDWRDSKLLPGCGCSQEEDEPTRAGWRNTAWQAHQNALSVFPITTPFCHNTSNFKSNDPALERARSIGWLQTQGQLGPSC